MYKNLMFLLAFSSVLPRISAQNTDNSNTNALRINNAIRLPEDTLLAQPLTAAIQGFLSASQKPIKENAYILPDADLETSLLLDEFVDIEKSKSFEDEHFYKPYLSGLITLEKDLFLVQLSYIGIKEETAYLHANFELLAHKTADGFLFFSPLSWNTKAWKILKKGNFTFKYKETINEKTVDAYLKDVRLYDKKLKIPETNTTIYCAQNFAEAQQLIGMPYKSSYNGIAENAFNFSAGMDLLIVAGNVQGTFDSYDPHDLWHERLGKIIPRNKVNRPVDEGCAYLYGGSWGLAWQDIFSAFLTQIAHDKQVDWRLIKENPVYFETNGFKNQADYIINALLVKKIEKEKGFEGVWTFLNCGKVEPGNAQYYAVLEQLTGITKEDYNQTIWELIMAERQ